LKTSRQSPTRRKRERLSGGRHHRRRSGPAAGLDRLHDTREVGTQRSAPPFRGWLQESPPRTCVLGGLFALPFPTMGEWKHRILTVTETQVHCQQCGWVSKIIKDGRPKCSAARRDQRRRRPNREYYWRGLPAPRGPACDVCGSTQRLCVDHDHSCCSGKARDACGKCYRGTLCHTCNVAEGWINKLIQDGNLERMLKYLDFTIES
jgi:hypothetical protein